MLVQCCVRILWYWQIELDWLQDTRTVGEAMGSGLCKRISFWGLCKIMDPLVGLGAHGVAAGSRNCQRTDLLCLFAWGTSSKRGCWLNVLSLLLNVGDGGGSAKKAFGDNPFSTASGCHRKVGVQH